jgi:hypothetical protein
VYGTDVGRQLLKKQNDWPPVVLTMTSFNQEVEHWRKSFDVGAITLLEKSLTTEEEISYYAATVLLRRALGLNNPDCKKAIQEVLETGRTAFQVLENFFRQFVVPEFASCIDTPFVIVLEQGKAISEDPSQVQSSRSPNGLDNLKEQIVELVTKAAYYAQVTELPLPLLIDKKVLELSSLIASESRSQVFFSPQFSELDDDLALSELMQDAAFIPLQLTSNIRLSLLLVKENKIPENPDELSPLSRAKVLAKYALDSLRITLVNLIERWKHVQEIKRVQLEELARFCEYVGVETKRLSYDIAADAEIAEENTNLQRFTLLADELCEAGNFLSELTEDSVRHLQRLVMQEVIQEAWDSLRSRSALLVFHGDCRATVVASKDELRFLFSRLLHWLISFYEEEAFGTPQIDVSCRLEGPYLEIALESNSSRLPKIVRDYLFVPMTQRINYDQLPASNGPKLFLAMSLVKIILEKRYQGSLTDHSDELTGDIGHKLVVKMSVLNTQERILPPGTL